MRLLLGTETPLVATRLLALASSALAERDAAMAQLAQLRQTLAEPRDAAAAEVGEATRDWQRLLLTLVATLGAHASCWPAEHAAALHGALRGVRAGCDALGATGGGGGGGGGELAAALASLRTLLPMCGDATLQAGMEPLCLPLLAELNVLANSGRSNPDSNPNPNPDPDPNPYP